MWQLRTNVVRVPRILLLLSPGLLFTGSANSVSVSAPPQFLFIGSAQFGVTSMLPVILTLLEDERELQKSQLLSRSRSLRCTHPTNALRTPPPPPRPFLRSLSLFALIPLSPIGQTHSDRMRTLHRRRRHHLCSRMNWIRSVGPSHRAMATPMTFLPICVKIEDGSCEYHTTRKVRLFIHCCYSSKPWNKWHNYVVNPTLPCIMMNRRTATIFPVLNESMAIFRHFRSNSLSLSQSDARSAGSIVSPLQAHPTSH